MAWWTFWQKRQPGPTAAEVGRELLKCGVEPHRVGRKGHVVTLTLTATVTVEQDVRRTAAVWLDANGTALRLLRQAYKALRAKSDDVAEKYRTALGPPPDPAQPAQQPTVAAETLPSRDAR
ncbi:MAG: hypothetical protein WC789_09435 [Lentisphaeria bacterium]